MTFCVEVQRASGVERAVVMGKDDSKFGRRRKRRDICI